MNKIIKEENRKQITLQKQDDNSNIFTSNSNITVLRDLGIPSITNNICTNNTLFRRPVMFGKLNSTPDITKVEEEVLKCIIGQNQQVRRILTAIYRSIEFPSIKSNILIIGKSGTGKTETVKQIAKNMSIPFVIEDATKFTKEGYVGADVDDMLNDLINETDGDLKVAEKGIIIVDEIDKKAGSDTNDVAGVEVLKSLLKIVEGTKIKINDPKDSLSGKKVDFDTNNLVIIFSGAFQGLDKIREKRLNVNQLGFSNMDFSFNKNEENRRITKQDLIEYGLPAEFVGRIDTIIEMNPLEKNDLIQILQKSQLSILKKYRAELQNKGIKLVYNSQLYERIAEKALEQDSGARELNVIVNQMFEELLYNIFSNPSRYSKCSLSLKIVNDNTKYKLS